MRRAKSRVRVYALVYLGVSLALGILAIAYTAGSQVSTFTYLVGNQDRVLLTLPTRGAVLFLSLVGVALAVWQGRQPRASDRGLGVAVTLWVAALLVWFTRDQRLNLPGMLQSTLVAATPITLGALCGIFSERSGVINIAIEGMMLSGALTAAAVFAATGSPWLGLLGAMLTSALMSGLHAVLSVRYKADQIISGTVVNILAFNATRYLNLRLLEPAHLSSPGTFASIRLPLLADIPVLGPILFDNQPTIYLMILLVPLVHVALFHTRWGLRTRAVGEHPRAADTMGVHVNRTRYINLFIGGLIAGIGGAYFSIGEVGAFEDGITNGKGFVALAAMIFGKWTPFGSLGASLLFGFADALQVKLQILKVGIPHQFLQTTPYVLTIVVLAGVIGRAIPPAAIGRPYEAESSE